MIFKKGIAVGWLALAAAFAGGSSDASAASACQQWDVNGRWYIQQSGDSYGYFDVEQQGNLLQGRGFADSLSSRGPLRGPLDGVLNGNDVQITVYWHGNVVGVYNGTIGPTGRVEGRTFDKRHPSTRAAWFTSNRMKCAARASQKPPPPPEPQAPPAKKKIKVLGKKKLEPKSGEQDNTCLKGFVWRVARQNDLVCVTPESRERTAQENKRAPERRDPTGAYGPFTCVSGFVWREAFEGDTVCVTPETRALVREENRQAPTRRVGG
jgi:hypothetical protein